MVRESRLPAGLFCRRCSRGKKYFIQFDHQRRHHYVWLGAISLEAAKDMLRQYREHYAADGCGLASGEPKLKKNFRDHLKDYVSFYERCGKTNRPQNQNLANYLPILGDKLVSTITSADVEDAVKILQGRKVRPLGPVTLKKSVEALQYFFGWLIKQNILRQNPVGVLAKTIIVPRRSYFEWHPQDDLRLLEAMTIQTVRTGFCLALEVGLRIEAVQNLSLDDIEFRHDTNAREYVRVRVRAKYLKGKKSKGGPPEFKISYSTILMKELRAQVRIANENKSSFLFPSQTKINESAADSVFRRGFQRACENIFSVSREKCKLNGTPYPRFHDIRHVFSTRADRLISNDNYVRATTSHESAKTHRIYQHLTSPVGADLSKDLMADYASAVDKLRQLPTEKMTPQ